LSCERPIEKWKENKEKNRAEMTMKATFLTTLIPTPTPEIPTLLTTWNQLTKKQSDNIT
jgi:hypothetical protein